jgi:hypothetical protein
VRRRTQAQRGFERVVELANSDAAHRVP